jgi:uncharacterized repeat protein (TIGR03803 family)
MKPSTSIPVALLSSKIGRRWRTRLVACAFALGAGVLVATTLAPRAGAADYQETTLYNFCVPPGELPNCRDGARPYAGLLMDSAGNLYSSTFTGGIADFPDGVVYKLTPDKTGTAWTETVLAEFCTPDGNCPNGANPTGSLIMDKAGRLYGTTGFGGTSQILTGGGGVVFKLTPDKTGTAFRETVLYSFCQRSECADGADPNVGLVMDKAGNLYGSTSGGGNAEGAGVVFELTPDKTGSGWKETVLHTFCSQGGAKCTDGSSGGAGFSISALMIDTGGNLYGTTLQGGVNGFGVVFELTPPDKTGKAWTETVLYDFCSQTNCTDGADPTAGLVMDKAGNLYGTTGSGGPGNQGAVFALEPNKSRTAWTETVLCGTCADIGTQPYSGVIRDKAGNLYGTGARGGANSGGVIFELQKSP